MVAGRQLGQRAARTILLERGLTTDQIDQLNPPYDPTRPIITSQTGYQQAAKRPTTAAGGLATHMTPAAASGMMAAADSLRAELALAGAGPALAGSNGFVVAPSTLRDRWRAAGQRSAPRHQHAVGLVPRRPALHSQLVRPARTTRQAPVSRACPASCWATTTASRGA